MTQKILRIIISAVAIMCLFSNTLVAFAENGDVDFDFNIQPIEPTTQEEVLETEVSTEAPTEAPTEEPTEAPIEKPDKKPTKPQTTRPQQKPENDKVTTTQPVVQEPVNNNVDDGSFYVYMEKNNGEKRLKILVERGDIIPKPSVPTRKGYIFDGWYSDSEFKQEWDFEKDKAQKSMTVYAKWIADENTIEYDIVIADTVGGKLETNPTKATKGEPVFITVIPDEGKRLVAGSLTINGESTDVFSFVMPKGKVKITAAFEDVPETITEGKEEEKNIVPFVIGAVVLIAIIVAVVIVVLRRREFNADLDPDEETPSGMDEGTDWIDESIIVQDGFKEGKKVAENVEPDFGDFDIDE